MCYSASQLHFKAYKNAIHKGAAPEEVERLYREYLESYLDEENVDQPINYKYFYV
jgi:hypothetical protein